MFSSSTISNKRNSSNRAEKTDIVSLLEKTAPWIKYEIETIASLGIICLIAVSTSNLIAQISS